MKLQKMQGFSNKKLKSLLGKSLVRIQNKYTTQQYSSMI